MDTAGIELAKKRTALFADQPGIDSQTGGSATTLLSGYREADNNRLTKTILGGRR